MWRIRLHNTRRWANNHNDDDYCDVANFHIQILKTCCNCGSEKLHFRSKDLIYKIQISSRLHTTWIEEEKDSITSAIIVTIQLGVQVHIRRVEDVYKTFLDVKWGSARASPLD